MGKKLTDGWDEVFRTGPAIDSQGRPHNVTCDDIDRIIAKYDEGKKHQAAVTIGHPDGKAPAYGWVVGLKRDGEVMLAKYDQVDPAFEEAVKAGRFKKKSVGLRDDFGLDHVAYLGAQPPAIKGLKDYEFAAADVVTCIEFSDYDDRTVAGLFRRLREFIIEKFGKDSADKVIPDWEVTDLQIAAVMPEEPALSCYHEQHTKEENMRIEDLAKEVDGLKAGLAAANQTIATFSETNKKLGDSVVALQKQLADGENAMARREFTEFCAGLKTRILPAEVPTLVDQLMNLRSAAPVEFEEAGAKRTITAVDNYKARLSDRAETVQFGEFATDAAAVNRQAAGGDAVTLARKATEFQDAESKAGRTVSLTQALLHVEAQMTGGAK